MQEGPAVFAHSARMTRDVSCSVPMSSGTPVRQSLRRISIGCTRTNTQDHAQDNATNDLTRERCDSMVS
eukprot:4093320-Pleurochrysis_carterae.AAC.1